ncbi:hypothetical protein QE404_001073 [Chryseobacterium camelliae]|uniref:Transposase n=1 Tax=Chryseobacterium camelliae TaxID=1265445 RepID=A0ABU0TGI4_9FLAO|nr:hypothetical protein [Chryseobacterium camelliae]
MPGIVFFGIVFEPSQCGRSDQEVADGICTRKNKTQLHMFT